MLRQSGTHLLWVHGAEVAFESQDPTLTQPHTSGGGHLHVVLSPVHRQRLLDRDNDRFLEGSFMYLLGLLVPYPGGESKVGLRGAVAS